MTQFDTNGMQVAIKGLLSVSNPKILKGAARGYLTSILHLAPARLSGYNVCPMATAGCSAACLNTSGMGGIFKKGETTNPIQQARIRKTLWFMERRAEFMAQLIREIRAAIKKAAKLGVIPVFRLNGTSDIRWETVSVPGFKNIMEMFPTIRFYDYTKIPNRRNLPANYHLTFSLAESNMGFAQTAIRNGMNVAAVFKTVPTTYSILPGIEHTVINGDEDDLRFLDPSNVIVGLKAKGRAKKDTSGFVRN